MKNLYKKYHPEIKGSIICLALGMLSGYSAQAGDSLWYLSLNKPSFNPPSFLFGPVWTLLYIMIGIVLAKIWCNKEKNKWLLAVFMLQLVCNLIWSPIFFYFHRIDLALFDILLMWLSIIVFMILATHKKILVYLFAPYLLWVSFAMVLNHSIYKLN